MNKKISGNIILYLSLWLIVGGLLCNVSAVAKCTEYNCDNSTPEIYGYKEECKEIIAMNTATAGEYNLHMKVRDPSRHDVQVLFICEPGYHYTYHHPQTGETMDFTLEHRIIGTTSINDKPPEIMKPGMVLTGSGISFGTNDCPTLMYTNPSRNAWDDFDWIRYAYQIANTEDEAVELLTKEAVDELHATGIGETLYVVGAKKGYAIEADAYNYHVEEIKDIYVKSNYPEFLWDVCSSDQYKYAPQFDTKYDDWAREYQIIKLGVKCTLGVTIKSIANDHIIAKAIPGDGEEVKVNTGENQSLGNFRVSLLATSGFSDIEPPQQKKAHVRICYKYLEWRNRLFDIMNMRKGEIGLADLMNWSRLHSSDLDGLRGFCEGDANDEEAVNIFRHQLNAPELMSSLWFSGIPCCSVYAPVHVCARDIYEPFKSGEAWEITLELLENYGHGTLPTILKKIENVIITENDEIESIGYKLLDKGNNSNIIDLLTYSDNMLQCHAFKMEQIILNLSQLKGMNDDVIESVQKMWAIDYLQTLANLKNVVNQIAALDEASVSDSRGSLVGINNGILEIMKTAAWYKINEAVAVVGETDSGLKESKKIYQEGLKEVDKDHFTNAAGKFLQAFEIADSLVKGEQYHHDEGEQVWTNNSYLIVTSAIILVVVLCAIVRWKKKKERDL